MTARSFLNRVLSWFQGALLLVASVAIGFCGYASIDTWLAQQRSLERLDAIASGGAPSSFEEGAPLGQIAVPRLGLSSAILEGTSDHTLQLSVGHVRGTARPGQAGNICLAGHRDSFFRPLRRITPGDEIWIRSPEGPSVYRVVETRIVGREQTSVLAPESVDVLTLVTCYPFEFFGSAPERFVVRAVRAGNFPRAQSNARPKSWDFNAFVWHVICTITSCEGRNV